MNKIKVSSPEKITDEKVLKIFAKIYSEKVRGTDIHGMIEE